MSKRSVQVNTFFPKRIFAPDIWGAKTQEEVDVEYDEYNIISKFAAKTIPSVNSFTTREQRYSSTQENDFTYVGNFLDDNQRYVKDSVNTNNSAYPTKQAPKAIVDNRFSNLAPVAQPSVDEYPHDITSNEVISYQQNIEAQKIDREIIAFEQSELENESNETSSNDFAGPEINITEPVIQASTDVQVPIAKEETSLYQEPVAYHETIGYQEPVYTPQPNITEETDTYKEPIVIDEPVIYNATNTTDTLKPFSFEEDTIAPQQPDAHDNFVPSSASVAEQVPTAQPTPVPLSEYEKYVAQSAEAEELKQERENTDFDYNAYRGENATDLKNDSLQFANSEYVDRQIEEIETKELQDSQSISELLVKFKKQILTGVAVVVFIMCLATLYVIFTSSSEPTKVPVPVELKDNTSGEKPVIVVPSQNGVDTQAGYDQNGNPIGQ